VVADRERADRIFLKNSIEVKKVVTVGFIRQVAIRTLVEGVTQSNTNGGGGCILNPL
jgi:hypothetical protein